MRTLLRHAARDSCPSGRRVALASAGGSAGSASRDTLVSARCAAKHGVAWFLDVVDLPAVDQAILRYWRQGCDVKPVKTPGTCLRRW